MYIAATIYEFCSSLNWALRTSVDGIFYLIHIYSDTCHKSRAKIQMGATKNIYDVVKALFIS